MRASQLVGNLVKIAVLFACVYAVVNWQTINPQQSDVAAFAESACIDAARARYEVSRLRAYEIKERDDGYIVRISATLSKGTAAKVICLTNAHGSVRDISIDVR